MGRETEPRESERVDRLGSAEAEEELKWAFYDLDFSIHKSRRYHEKLANFYAAWRDRFRVVTAIAGSGAFIVVVSGVDYLGEILTGFVALWAVIDIIMAPDKKSDLHSDLSKKFTELAARIAVSRYSEAVYGELKASRLMIEELEPPCKRLVDLEARNDECRSRDFPPTKIVPLSRWQRRLGRYFDFGLQRLEEWKDQQAI